MVIEPQFESSGGAELCAGASLRRAREAAQIDLGAVAAWTRIKEHHLTAIEQGDYAALPAPMYAVAFARSYARAIGYDDAAIARQVRAELDRSAAAAARRLAHHVPLEDPAKIPSARLSWATAAVAVAILAGTTGFWRSALAPAGELPPVSAEETVIAAPELSAAAQISPTAESAVMAAARIAPSSSRLAQAGVQAPVAGAASPPVAADGAGAAAAARPQAR